MKRSLINNSDEYFKFFTKGDEACQVTDLSKESKKAILDDGKLDEALKCALDIRKFEIELYWKRASYFWVLIGAALVAYVAVLTKGSNHVAELSVVISCLGFIFSCAWLAVNKGSKFWQENWEKHVDMLEDKKIGSLYKIVFNNNQSFLSLGGGAFSVSKINLIVSFYVVSLWFLLLVASMTHIWWPNLLREYISFLITMGAMVSVVFCGLFLFTKVCKSRIDFSYEKESEIEGTAKAMRRARCLP